MRSLRARVIKNGSISWARHSPLSPPAEWLSHSPDENSIYSLNLTFAGLLLHLSEEDDRVGQGCALKVTITDHSSNGGTEVDLTAPATLCEEFNATSFLSEDDSITANSAMKSRPKCRCVQARTEPPTAQCGSL